MMVFHIVIVCPTAPYTLHQHRITEYGDCQVLEKTN